LTFVGGVEDEFPEGGKTGLDECENIFLDLDDAFVEIGLMLGEERLEIGGVNVGRTLSLWKGKIE